MNFGERLINLRKQKGMSQEELAEKLNMTRQTISKWELGVSTPDMESLKNISNLFGISVDELISNNEKTNTTNNNINNNPEYVGINGNYMQNNETYTKENKQSKKILGGYLILVVVGIIIILAIVLGLMWKMFSGIGNVNSKFNNQKDEIIKSRTEMMEEAQNSFSNFNF